MSRAPLAVAAALLLALGGGAVAWLGMRGGRERAVPPAATGPTPGGVAATAPARPRYPGDDVPAVREDAPSTVTMSGAEAFGASLTAAAAPRLARDAAIRDALRAAREGRLGPGELERKLREAAGDDPVLGATLLEALLEERRPEIAMVLARLLAGCLDDPSLRARTIEALRAAGPEARAVGLLALLGRGERDALLLGVESFCEDPPEARATAGFILNNAPELPAELRARAEAAARAALEDAASPARVREESCGLLGAEDAGLLERAFVSGPEATVRGRALRALVEAGVPGARLRPLCERVAAEPGCPAELREAIRVVMARE